MDNTKKGILNSIYGVLGQVLITAFAFFLPKLIIENYGSETNGFLHSVGQIISYLSLLEAGVGAATLQALYSPVANKDERKISAIISATDCYYKKIGLLYALGVIIISILYPLLIQTYLPYAYAVGIAFFSGIGGCISFFYQGKYIPLMNAEGYSYIIEKIDIITNIILNVSKFFLLRISSNVLIIQVVIFLISLFKGLLFYKIIRKKYGWINLKESPDNIAIKEKKSVLVHQIASMIFSSTDVFLLTVLIGDLKIVSVYTLYYAIVYAIFNVIQKLTSGFNYKFGQIYNTNREKYSLVYSFIEIVDLISAFSVMSALYMVFMPLIKLYTRKVTDINYVDNILPLLFIITPLLSHGRQAAFSTLFFSGHYTQTKKYAVIESIINIIISIPGILLFGIPGALLGTIVATVYRTVNAINYTYKYLINGKKKNTIKRWLICIGIFITVIVFNKYIPLPEMNSFITIGIVSIGLTLMFTLIYSVGQYIINMDEREMFRQIIKTRSIKEVFGLKQ